MARPAFKQIWTRIVPQPIERSTYVLASNLVLIVLMWQWRGIDAVIWDIQQPLLRTAMWVLFAAGWLLVPFVTFLIDHFDLFGIRQVWLHLRGRPYEALPFRTPLFYKHVRHPLYNYAEYRRRVPMFVPRIAAINHGPLKERALDFGGHTMVRRSPPYGLAIATSA